MPQRTRFLIAALLLVGSAVPAQLTTLSPMQADHGLGTMRSLAFASGVGGLVLSDPDPGGADVVNVIVELAGPALVFQQHRTQTVAALADLELAEDRFERGLAALIRPDERTLVRVSHRFTRVFHGAALTVPSRVFGELARIPGVRRVHLDARVTASIEHSVPEIGAPEVWSNYGTRGEGVIVAVIDTGIDYTHPALGGGFGPGFKVIGGHDFVNDDGDPTDDNGHGTHVAGIVAADGEGLTGVAPGAKLLAYKVLDAEGSGTDSDVIAAIEAAVDPDGNGDTSDHAAVVNLSLGGKGGPDDAVSLAADAAVEAGVVVCAAAGNQYHSGFGPGIGSPAAARRVLAVGASQGGVLAEFSSWGPGWGTVALKPELVAPGVAIRSAAPGGGTALKSGTSMASPHVAGVAALLRAIHPDWNPAQVASALVTTATDLGLDVMGQGGGKVNAPAAAAASLFAEPVAVSFGADTAGDGPWNSTRTLRVTNGGTVTRSISIAVTGVPHGATLTWAPASLTLPPGAATDLVLTLTVDGQALPPVPESFSFGGSLLLSTDGQAIHVPWAFAKCARLHVVTPGFLSLFMPARVFPNPGYLGTDKEGRRVYDILVPEGESELLSSGANPEVGHWVILREIEARGELSFEFAVADAKNRITMPSGSVPATGTHLTEVALLLRSGWLHFNLSTGIHAPLFSDIPSHTPVIVSEWRNPGSEADRSFHRVAHPPLPGLTGNVVLGPVAGSRYPVSVELPDSGSSQTARVDFGECDPNGRNMIDLQLPGLGFELEPAAGPFELILTDQQRPGPLQPCVFVVATSDEPALDLVAGPLRAVEGRLGNLLDATAPPTTYWVSPGERLKLGGGLHHPALETSSAGPDTKLRLDLDIEGPLGESHNEGTATMVGELRRLDGSPIAGLTIEPAWMGGAIIGFPPDLAEPIELVVSSAYSRGGRDDARTMLTLGFDPRQEPFHYPSLTSLMLLDASGRHLLAAPLGQPGTALRFSAIGCSEREDCTALDEPATTVKVRAHGATEWQEVAVELDQLDIGPAAELGHLAVGRLFNVPVPGDLLGQAGWVDVLISIANAAGARAEWVLEPGFEVQPPPPPRRRLTSSH